MSTSRISFRSQVLPVLLPVAALCLIVGVSPGLCQAQHPNLGRPLAPEEIRKLDITVAPDGKGLPPGNGSVSTGATVYEGKCQSCHGVRGAGPDPLTGGIGTLASAKPVKTPVSYWPSATTIFDYVRRAMPLPAPLSLTNDEVYAVTAYILSIDGIVSGDTVLDAKSLPQVKMPNRNGFERWWPAPKR